MNTLKIYDFSTPPAEAEQRLTVLLAKYRAHIDGRLAQGSPYTWNNLIIPTEEFDAQILEIWSPLGHRNSVTKSDELTEVFLRCLALVSDFGVDMSQNKELFEAYQEIADSKEFTSLLPEQQKVITNALRDFRLGGVNLPPLQKAQYKENAKKLSDRMAKFENNITDATNAWEKHTIDESVLSGLPEAIKMNARKKAEKRGLDGYVLTMDDGTASKVGPFADNRKLREEFFFVRNTRCSDQGPNAGTFDNSALAEEILALRHEQALLLGFKNYAELSLATKMAESTDEVMIFLRELAAHASIAALREYEELSAFAKERDGLERLEQWDVGYYIQQLKKKKYSFNQEELSQYFPLPQVLDGMFTVVNRLYGIRLQEKEGRKLWHREAKFFELYSKDDELIGGIYMDFFARDKKRGGAWMDEAVRLRELPNGEVELPVAYLTSNFTPGTEDKPPLLTHDEMITLFHEFGHDLNHLLTRIKRAMAVSGLNGVEWDAVELPSQFMENFCEERESLDLFAKHYITGEKIPDELFQKMRAARTFGQGFAVLRQNIFAQFDFRLHLEYNPAEKIDSLHLYNEVYSSLSPTPTNPKWNRFPRSFGHIFAGGYAAGYFSYPWAEVLSADAFAPFLREDGTIDWSMGQKFLNEILSRGGSRTATENFVAYRGRKSTVNALLRQYGFIE